MYGNIILLTVSRVLGEMPYAMVEDFDGEDSGDCPLQNLRCGDGNAYTLNISRIATEFSNSKCWGSQYVHQEVQNLDVVDALIVEFVLKMKHELIFVGEMT
jgi:hypothetical protein